MISYSMTWLFSLNITFEILYSFTLIVMLFHFVNGPPLFIYSYNDGKLRCSQYTLLEKLLQVPS